MGQTIRIRDALLSGSLPASTLAQRAVPGNNRNLPAAPLARATQAGQGGGRNSSSLRRLLARYCAHCRPVALATGASWSHGGRIEPQGDWLLGLVGTDVASLLLRVVWSLVAPLVSLWTKTT